MMNPLVTTCPRLLGDRLAPSLQDAPQPGVPPAVDADADLLLHRVRRRPRCRLELAGLRLPELHDVPVRLRPDPVGGLRRRLRRLLDRRGLRIGVRAPPDARHARPLRARHRLHDLGARARLHRLGRRDGHRPHRRRRGDGLGPRHHRDDLGRDAHQHRRPPLLVRRRDAHADDAGGAAHPASRLPPHLHRAGLRPARAPRGMGRVRVGLQPAHRRTRGVARVGYRRLARGAPRLRRGARARGR